MNGERIFFFVDRARSLEQGFERGSKEGERGGKFSSLFLNQSSFFSFAFLVLRAKTHTGALVEW